MKLSPPVTATGASRCVVVPSPSCPRPFTPQQYAAPADVTPHVWLDPPLTLANFTPPFTGTGDNLSENVLSPSPTRHHELAVTTIRRGTFAPLFWGGAIAAGAVVPLGILGSTAVLSARAPAAAIVVASLLALAGSAAWEYIWVEAGQSVPLS